MIEDCAHCFFGQAGERPIGAWGDFATASLTKFFPVPEGGLLASSSRPLPGLALA
ncbi:MAG: DegT/DnrJ/EryC1/StrS family aminotransferase [Rhodoferax sp.]|nr:DegT/DnrJ/EryC1/StrS family aminotransferase [Rhodoferax sp.]